METITTSKKNDEMIQLVTFYVATVNSKNQCGIRRPNMQKLNNPVFCHCHVGTIVKNDSNLFCRIVSKLKTILTGVFFCLQRERCQGLTENKFIFI